MLRFATVRCLAAWIALAPLASAAQAPLSARRITWADVGPLLAQVVDRLSEGGAPGEGDGLTLFYVPSSTLGQERDLDLRWEVDLVRGGQVAAYDNESSPAAVLRLFTDGPRDATGPAGDDWGQVGPLLQQVAGASHRLLSPDAVIELSCRWAAGAAPPGWVWRFEAEVGDELDDPRLVFAYDGRTPVECLRAARDDAARWAPR